jgi:hypothetical protein
MRRFFFAVAVFAAMLDFVQQASAGLTVTFSVNGMPQLLTLGSGTNPDTNSPNQNGMVNVGATVIDVDGDGPDDIFIENILATSTKSFSEGRINTISTSVFSTGSAPATVEINVFDDFSLPPSVFGTEFNVLSNFTDLNDGLAVALTGSTSLLLESFLDGVLVSSVAVDAVADVGASSVALGATTGPSPFSGRSRYTFSIDPGTTVRFTGNTVFSAVPEPASLIAWSLGIFSMILVAFRKRP